MDDPTIREGRDDEVDGLAEAFRSMWLDNEVPPEAIESDYRDRVRRFVADGRERAQLRFFVAESEGRIVGTVCAQLFDGLYPAILTEATRRYGYVWGVYVAPARRRTGLGKRLTERAVEALRELSCTHVLLHAAPPGRGIYERLGFESTNEMRLTLER